jgi:hypothetical protein
LWPRQEDYIDFLEQQEGATGEWLCEKSRDMGVTTLNAGFALHRWLFVPGYKTTFGSRVEDLVDKLGNPDTIFEKIRTMLYLLPDWLRPLGYDENYDRYMRINNPENGNVIIGEAGKNMGRGGRSTMYFVDEAAHVDNADQVEMAIVANSDCRGWVSSVNGMGNLFARKRHSGRYPVFVFDMMDDPRKDKGWLKRIKATTEPHVFAQEYSRDYGASIEGAMIPHAWVRAAVELFKSGIVEPHPAGTGIAGMDVGAGRAKSVCAVRRGPVLFAPKRWTSSDTVTVAYEALEFAKERGARVMNYDSVGVGHSVTTAFIHAEALKVKPIGVNVGLPPSGTIWPDGRTSTQLFGNKKAEIWWIARTRFQKAYERWLWENGEEGGMDHPLDDVVAMEPDNELEAELASVKWFRNTAGKIVCETKIQLSKRGIKSPDNAEAVVLTYDEPPEEGGAVFHIN